MSASPRTKPKPKANVINPRLAAEQARNASPEAQAWLKENAEAIRSWNEYVEKHGLPLAKYRQF